MVDFYRKWIYSITVLSLIFINLGCASHSSEQMEILDFKIRTMNNMLLEADGDYGEMEQLNDFSRMTLVDYVNQESKENPRFKQQAIKRLEQVRIDSRIDPFNPFFDAASHLKVR